MLGLTHQTVGIRFVVGNEAIKSHLIQEHLEDLYRLSPFQDPNE